MNLLDMPTLTQRRGSPDSVLQSNGLQLQPIGEDDKDKSSPYGTKSKIFRYIVPPVILGIVTLILFVPNYDGINPVSNMR